MSAQTSSPCTAQPGADLPDDPGCALNYHYGMLLGAADLRTEQGFHIGQRRRHARNLHGRGVVQGLGVQLRPERHELLVRPGLALDARGRELALAEAHCVHLGAWWMQARTQPAFAAQRELQTVTLQLLLTLQHHVCADRPVPAVAPACEAGDASAMVASRLCESARLELQDASTLPPAAHGVPADELPVYALLGLAATLPAAGTDPDTDWAVAARAAIAAAAPEDRSAAALAALDRAIALGTARVAAPEPSAEDRLPLARVHDLVLQREPDTPGAPERWTVLGGRVELLDRPALLATGTLQRLLAALLASTPVVAGPVVSPPSPPPPPPPAPTPPAPPPPAAPALPPPLITSAVSAAERLTLQLAVPVHPGSAKPVAVAVTEFDEAFGWRNFTVRHVDVEDGGRRLLLTLGHPPRETLLRVTLSLDGTKPLLAADRSELAGLHGPHFTLHL
ncbi:hypothetical protein IP80_05375 [beta proteobacterium AAP65]|nr:hypothetical protein IP80_05375 [beta proteobacterium AAP65]